MLQVRPATAADQDRVIEIALACDPEDWLPEAFDSFFETDSTALLVAEQEGRVVGCFAYEWHPDRQQAYLMGMRIDPAAQGQGLGSAFCKAQIDWLTASGARRLTLLSERQNVRAHRTVERNGFVNVGPWVVWHVATRTLLDVTDGASAIESVGATADLRQWWAEHAAGEYAGQPDSAWTLFPLTAADFLTEPLLHLGTEGALLWGREDDAWTVRWASGSPAVLRTLLASFARMAQAAGVEQIVLSLPGHLEPLLAEASIVLPDPWRDFLFLYTAA